MRGPLSVLISQLATEARELAASTSMGSQIGARRKRLRRTLSNVREVYQ